MNRPGMSDEVVDELRDLLAYEVGGSPHAAILARIVLTLIDERLCDLLAESLPTETMRAEIAKRGAP